MKPRTLIALLAAALAVALPAAAATSGAPKVTNAWARATAGGQEHGAAYMTIAGTGTADRLVSASVPMTVAMHTQLHRSMMDSSGKMEMHEVKGIAVPAGGKVTLKPGGLHVMLMELAKPLRVGTTFRLTLTFAKAGKRTITVKVRAA